MALEDILKGYARLGSVSQLVQNLAQDPTNPESFEEFINYNINYEGLSQDDALAMAEQIRKDPIKLRELTNVGVKSSRKNLVEKVGADYAAVISALSKESLVKLAMNMPDKDKTYLEIDQAVKNGNYGAAKKAYAQVYEKSAVWKNFIETADDEFIKKYIDSYLRRTQNAFMEKNLAEPVMKDGKQEKDKQGNLKYELDAKKISDYIGKQLKSYKDDQKEGFYITVAGLYAQQEMEKAKKAKK